MASHGLGYGNGRLEAFLNFNDNYTLAEADALSADIQRLEPHLGYISPRVVLGARACLKDAGEEDQKRVPIGILTAFLCFYQGEIADKPAATFAELLPKCLAFTDICTKNEQKWRASKVALTEDQARHVLIALEEHSLKAATQLQAIGDNMIQGANEAAGDRETIRNLLKEASEASDEATKEALCKQILAIRRARINTFVSGLMETMRVCEAGKAGALAAQRALSGQEREAEDDVV